MSGLVELQVAVFPAPAIATLRRFPDAPTNLPNRLALGQNDLGLTKVVDDLFDVKSLPRHLLAPLLTKPRCPKSLTQHLDPVKGGRADALPGFS